MGYSADDVYKKKGLFGGYGFLVADGGSANKTATGAEITLNYNFVNKNKELPNPAMSSKYMSNFSKAVTWDQFKSEYEGLSYRDLLTDKGPFTGRFDSQPQGPIDKFRYVKDPRRNDRVLDMRHVLGVGMLYGEYAGSGLEGAQLAKYPKSALNPQDFYSNKVGKQIGEYIHSQSNSFTNPVQKAFYLHKILNNDFIKTMDDFFNQ